jgi:hypothetical protein
MCCSNRLIHAQTCCCAGDDAELLDQVDLMVVKGSDDVIPINDKYLLKPLLTPTPRWPDLMCVLDPQSKMLYTSKLFSAHVAPGMINDKVGRQRRAARAGGLGGHCHLHLINSRALFMHVRLHCLQQLCMVRTPGHTAVTDWLCHECGSMPAGMCMGMDPVHNLSHS